MKPIRKQDLTYFFQNYLLKLDRFTEVQDEFSFLFSDKILSGVIYKLMYSYLRKPEYLQQLKPLFKMYYYDTPHSFPHQDEFYSWFIVWIEAKIEWELKESYSFTCRKQYSLLAKLVHTAVISGDLD